MSGAEEAVKEITDRLPSSEFDFHMITLRFSDTEAAEEKIGTISVHRVGFGPSYLRKILFIPLAALTARSLHKREHFDLFWSLMTYMLFPVLLARLLGTHVPYFLTLQDGDSYAKVFQRWYIRPFTPILDAGFRKAKAIQAISTYLATWPKLRRSDAPVFVIPNGANPRDLSQDVSRE